MLKILLTAFEPFGGESVNPAQKAVRLVPDEVGGARIIRMDVPVVFHKSINAVVHVIDAEKPDAVLCVGQAGGRSALTPERVAINLDDAFSPDNEGCQPKDQAVCPGGPDAYFATLPVKAMVSAIRARGLPASLSCSAGTYVCNHLMYGVLNHIHNHSLLTLAGFIHVPYLTEQVRDRPGVPSLTAEQIADGITAALESIADSLLAEKPRRSN